MAMTQRRASPQLVASERAEVSGYNSALDSMQGNGTTVNVAMNKALLIDRSTGSE